MDFGTKLKMLREEKGISREDLANKINMSYSTVSKYEQNVRFPDKDSLQRIADFFEVSVDYLLGRTDIRRPSEPTPEQRIEEAISDDPELLESWHELVKRDDLQLLFKQVKPLSPATIKRIIRYIKMVEDEEAQE